MESSFSLPYVLSLQLLNRRSRRIRTHSLHAILLVLPFRLLEGSEQNKCLLAPLPAPNTEADKASPHPTYSLIQVQAAIGQNPRRKSFAVLPMLEITSRSFRSTSPLPHHHDLHPIFLPQRGKPAGRSNVFTFQPHCHSEERRTSPISSTRLNSVWPPRAQVTQ